jgi:hypothetical protein
MGSADNPGFLSGPASSNRLLNELVGVEKLRRQLGLNREQIPKTTFRDTRKEKSASRKLHESVSEMPVYRDVLMSATSCNCR